MAEQAKPVENVKEVAQQVAKKEVTSPPKREYRTYLCLIGLLAVIGAFTTLTILVKTTPSFPIDLQITRALQSINSPLFAALMSLISWPGFSPQCYLIQFCSWEPSTRLVFIGKQSRLFLLLFFLPL